MGEPMAEKIVQRDRGKMRRVLGVLDLFAIGYGDLGSSIYYALGITALYALGATPIALMIAGLVFACTALTYAEMSSVIPDSGGSASFSRKSFNDLISFVAGWGLMLDYIVTIAISSFSIAPYLGYFFESLHDPWIKIIFTLGLIILLFVFNFIGAKHSTRISFVLTLFTILTQVLIIAIGLVTVVNYTDFFTHLKIGGQNLQYSPDWKGFIKGVAMAMVAYTGIESMAQLGSEAKNPSKTVPRAIMLAMTTLILMYMGVSLVALSALTPDELSTTYINNPIAGIVMHMPMLSHVLAPWVGLLAAILLFVAANAGLVGASRLAFNLGEYFQLPKFFYRIHPHFKTPHVALFFFTLFAGLIVIWSRGELEFLADLYNFGAMLAFFLAHLSLIRLRIKEPKLERPFKVPFNIRFKEYLIPIPSVIGAIVTFSVFCLVIFTKPEGRNLGILWLIFGIGMYVWYRRSHNFEVAGTLQVEKIELGQFKPFDVKKILVLCQKDKEAESTQLAAMIAKATGAKLDLCAVIEVPFSFPINTSLAFKGARAEALINFAQAIALEKGITTEKEVIKARSIEDAIIDKVNEEKHDLLIISVPQNLDFKNSANRALNYREIMKKTTCRVLICENQEQFINMQLPDQTDNNNSSQL